MKAWQKGYHLEYLEEIVERFEGYNELSCSPFSEMSKNKVAEALEKDTLKFLVEVMDKLMQLLNHILIETEVK